MKKHLILALILSISQIAICQYQIYIPKLDNLLKENGQIKHELNDFQSFTFDGSKLTTFLKLNPNSAKIELNLGEIKWKIDLIKSNIVSENTATYILTNTGKIQVNTPEILTYHGKLSDKINSRVVLTAINDYVHIVLHKNDESFIFQPANLYDNTLSKNKFILYQGTDSKEVLATCGVTSNGVRNERETQSNRFFSPGDIHKVRLAIASDHSMFIDKGSIEGVTTHAVMVMNNVATDYQTSDFPTAQEGIQYEIVEQVVSICADCDPWSSTTAVNPLLGSFTDWAQSGGFTNSHDMGSFWSNRNFDGSTVGLAWRANGLLCGGEAYHILQDFTTNSNTLRVLVSHEMGHNWSGTHDPSGSGTIMSPSVNNTVTWSAMSDTQVGGQIVAQGASCLESESAITCQPVTNVVVSNITATSVNLAWNSSGGTSDVRIRIREEGSSTFIYNSTSTASSATITPPLELCKTYQLLIERDCGAGDYSAIEGAIFQTPHATAFNLVSIEDTNCTGSTHDLEIVVEHGGGNGSGFVVNVGGTNYPQSFSSSPQTITITGLSNTASEVNISISAVVGGSASCNLSTTYLSPTIGCLLFEIFDMDNCIVPSGWTITGNGDFIWKVDGDSRPILNYSEAVNTINGTCMFYMDDDINSSSQFTGTTTLTSPIYDLTGIASPRLEFIYNFHNFEDGKSGNSSSFTVDVYDGTAWQNVLTDSDDSCPWSNVWNNNCETNMLIDLSPFNAKTSGTSLASANANFQVRFTYTDGGTGDWTGMIALDDIKILDEAALPVTLISFTGKATKKSNQLTWNTASEVNNDYFSVEKSVDGLTFSEIGRMTGAGYSTKELTYVYDDINPIKGNNYYRLKQVDYDGQYEYSKIILLKNRIIERLLVQPNPAIDFVQLNYTTYDQSIVIVEIIDLQGKTVLSQSFEAVQGNNSFRLDLSSLRSGVYVLKSNQKERADAIKLIISK